MGAPKASIPTPLPVHYGPMFSYFGGALHKVSITFISRGAIAGRVLFAARHGMHWKAGYRLASDRQTEAGNAHYSLFTEHALWRDFA